jgi:acyl-coenzyme A thioesterase PaaI-like protein
MGDSESPFWAAVRGEIPPPPAAKLLGWKVLEAEPGSGRIRVQFEATNEFTNPIGNVQGGFLAAMLDDTLGPALATTFSGQEFAPTLELKINLIRPAKCRFRRSRTGCPSDAEHPVRVKPSTSSA